MMLGRKTRQRWHMSKKAVRSSGSASGAAADSIAAQVTLIICSTACARTASSSGDSAPYNSSAYDDGDGSK
eukprot:scaffold245022_cov32-Tisochrysis_lutea.AAC.5